MIRTLLKYLNAWGPSMFIMAVIFFLSSRQSISVSEEHIWNFIVFKSLHVGEYALLTILNFRALLLTSSGNLHKKYTNLLVTAAVLALMYGITDEIHQTFVPTRTGKPVDVLIDMVGILLASAFVLRVKQQALAYFRAPQQPKSSATTSHSHNKK